MTSPTQRGCCLLLAWALALSLVSGSGAAVSEEKLDAAVQDTAQCLLRAVPAPQLGSVGGEWAVLGLARSGCAVPDSYYADYYAALEEEVRAREGQLHSRKYTEYSRVILALSALGADARDVAGYDLTLPLGDYDKTVWQGLNGPIWAMLALDSRDYPMPEAPAGAVQATRQGYVDHILARQLPDGGWSLRGGGAEDAQSQADPDLTAMALQALAKYQDQPAVAQATQAALDCMSRLQDDQGGYTAWGSANANSTVQMLLALCELGLPLDDPRFVKHGLTLLDHLLASYRLGEGFLYTAGDADANQMASEQAFCALVAVQRARAGQNSLYRMGDTLPLLSSGATAGRDPAVRPVPVTRPGRTFHDLSAHPDRAAIEALAAREILNGKGDGLFHPADPMTRAEFAALVVRALGLEPHADGAFSDVAGSDWFAGYVGTASALGVIQGVGEGRFAPMDTISKGEAAVMVARAARLCGIETALDPAAAGKVLAPFSDAGHVPEWARQGLAFCYDSGILDPSAPDIRAEEPVSRSQVAQMLFRLLDRAGLLSQEEG